MTCWLPFLGREACSSLLEKTCRKEGEDRVEGEPTSFASLLNESVSTLLLSFLPATAIQQPCRLSNLKHCLPCLPHLPLPLPLLPPTLLGSILSRPFEERPSTLDFLLPLRLRTNTSLLVPPLSLQLQHSSYPTSHQIYRTYTSNFHLLWPTSRSLSSPYRRSRTSSPGPFVGRTLALSTSS